MREIKSLKDITVRELIELSKVKDVSTMEGISKVMTIFYGKPDTMSLDGFFDKFTELSKVIFEQPALTPIDHFDFEGVTYRVKGVEEIQTKEFIDFDNLSRENPVENLPLLLAIGFTDGNEEGSYVKRTQERAKKFNTLDALTAQCAMLFFQQAFVAFAKAIVDCLPKEVSNQKKAELLKMLEGFQGSALI